MIDRLTHFGETFFIFGHCGIVDAAFVKIFGVIEDFKAVFFYLFNGEFKEGMVVCFERDDTVFFKQLFVSFKLVFVS